MGQLKKPEVQKFLDDFKAVAKESKENFDLVRHRPQNRTTLDQLGMDTRECLDQILSLTAEDYCKGPEDDRDRPGKFWFFGKKIEGHEIYIKLKLVEIGEKKKALCISFHIAEYAMRYPYK